MPGKALKKNPFLLNFCYCLELRSQMIILGDIPVHINHQHKVNGTAKKNKKTTYFREEIALVIYTGIHVHVINKNEKD